MKYFIVQFVNYINLICLKLNNFKNLYKIFSSTSKEISEIMI